MGDANSLLQWEKKTWEIAPLLSPTWETNVWAWIEQQGYIQFNWFKADHDDTIVNLPTLAYSVLLRNKGIPFVVPKIPYYQASSISHCHFHGRDIVNVRYVNYWLTDEGHYVYPDKTDIKQNVIRNLNLCGHVDSLMYHSEFGYSIMREGGLGLTECKEAFSYGLEDMRLYSGMNDTLQFIATTVGYSSVGVNQMVIGDYDDIAGECRNGRLIEGPFSVCEKNWIPLPDGEHFIYSWTPYRVGKIINNTLVIVDEVSIEWAGLRHSVRGSTVFSKYKEGQCIGVVHFSENGEKCRCYYHMMVVLDEMTRRPIRFSQPFTFCGSGIEFCIGLNVSLLSKIEKEYCFWVSKMDRDPHLFVLSNATIENLWIL
jgi:hypothetical protein